MRLLVLILVLVGCDERGKVGQGCYGNRTCDDDLICVRWSNAEKLTFNVCADPKSLDIGGFTVPKVCPELPDLGCEPCAPGWRRSR